MQGLSHHLVLTGDPGSLRQDLAAALAPRFSLGPGERSRTVRRVWLDTFDWQLHRAGLTLEYTTGSGRAEARLTGPNGLLVAVQGDRQRWPALAVSLPPGPVRSALLPVAGVRALLPMARAVSVLQALRALNADTKTVAWLTLDRMSPQHTPAAVHRLTVTAVRGYQAEADRITRCLTAPDAPAGPAPTALTVALAAAGRRQGDYTGKLDVHLDPAAPARQAVRDIALRLLDMAEANVPGTVSDLDTEFLHDLRVAVRRTRSLLKLAGDTLPRGLADRFGPEFKWLGDATTPTRDLDVYLIGYDAMEAGLVAATPSELAPLHAYLSRHRAGHWRRLVRVLRGRRFHELVTTWREALTTLRPQSRGPRTGALAAERIQRAHRRVLTRGAAITADSPPEALHDLRKRCKELRYALEFFASLHDPPTQKKVVKHLKGLQDCLGEYQDCQVQQLHLREFAPEMMRERELPATALLAMGELAAQLAVRQRTARAEFAGRFADFASPRVGRQFGALTGGGAR